MAVAAATAAHETLIYLNSGSSAQLFPDNTHAAFTVQLPTALDVTNCSVALAELCFSSDFSTLSKGSGVRLWGTESHVSSIKFTTPETFVDQLKLLVGAFESPAPSAVAGEVIHFEQNGRCVLYLPKEVTPLLVAKGVKTRRLGAVSDISEVTDEVHYAETFENRYVQRPAYVAYEVIPQQFTIPARVGSRVHGLAAAEHNMEAEPVKVHSGSDPLPTAAVAVTDAVSGDGQAAAPTSTSTITLMLTRATPTMLHEYTFPHARISSINDAVDMLQTAFAGHEVQFKLTASQVAITTRHVLELSEDVALMLGWPAALRLGPGEHVAPASVALNFRSSNIFVCTDIIEYMLLGDTYDRVLRSVALDVGRQHGMHVYKAYDDGQFHRCTAGVITNITLQLRTDTGELLPLNSGPISTWVVLKLRYDGGGGGYYEQQRRRHY